MGRRILRRRGLHHRLFSEQEEPLPAGAGDGTAKGSRRSSGGLAPFPCCDARDGKDRWSKRIRDLCVANAGLRETQATIALLWAYLSPVKRGQASAAIREVLDGYRSGRLKARQSRRLSSDHVTHAGGVSVTVTADDLDRSWAAGFLDAEGCFGTYHSRPRKGGADWFRIRVSATQHGDVGVPADVLLRLHRALGSLGRIERHGDPDDFRWLAEGTDAVDCVLARTGRWLGTVKADQAQLALRRFRAQVRLRGSATHCVRGHEYTGSSIRGGRLRRICRPCDRINSRLRRAAAGILPRQFRNEARRYTF
jgi:hypothetical protein